MTAPQTILLFGGRSTERHVSVATAQNIARHLPGTRAWFETPQGMVLEVPVELLAAHQNPFKADFSPSRSTPLGALVDAVKTVAGQPVVFVLGYHGGDGENGTVQEVLEKAGLPFTGSGAAASRKAFDKVLAKKIVKAAGLRVCAELEIDGENLSVAQRLLENFLKEHREVILKPVADGSSVGLFRLNQTAQVADVLKTIAASGHARYLAEPFVKGTEITVGVMDTAQGPRALPPSEVEITSTNDFDYDAKYLGRGCKEITPARLDATATERCQQAAVTAHTALGCRGYTRTDLILTPGGIFYLETNTLPGLTRASFIPQQLEVAGIAFPEFLSLQLQIAQGHLPASARHHG